MGIKDRVMQNSREKKFQQFMESFNPTERDKVLDVGVSSYRGSRKENYFVQVYPYKNNLTGLGIGNLSNFREDYPEVRTVEYDGKIFPFEDNEHEFVHSNAVIEHVGGWEDQKTFVSEMKRVGKKGMFTTPNKFFPIETHYMVPILHWQNNKKFEDFAAKYLGGPIGPLSLLGKRALEKLCQSCSLPNYKIIKNRFLGMTMTFSVFWDKNPLHTNSF